MFPRVDFCKRSLTERVLVIEIMLLMPVCLFVSWNLLAMFSAEMRLICVLAVAIMIFFVVCKMCVAFLTGRKWPKVMFSAFILLFVGLDNDALILLGVPSNLICILIRVILMLIGVQFWLACRSVEVRENPKGVRL